MDHNTGFCHKARQRVFNLRKNRQLRHNREAGYLKVQFWKHRLHSSLYFRETAFEMGES
jgi:hypothetical protein